VQCQWALPCGAGSSPAASWFPTAAIGRQRFSELPQDPLRLPMGNNSCCIPSNPGKVDEFQEKNALTESAAFTEGDIGRLACRNQEPGVNVTFEDLKPAAEAGPMPKAARTKVRKGTGFVRKELVPDDDDDED